MATFVRALAALVACGYGAAHASAQETTLAEVIEDCPEIFVAKYSEKQPESKSEVTLEILRVLHGEVKPGRITVWVEDTPRGVRKESEFVAFLDSKTVWRFVAVPIKKETVKGSALTVNGFSVDEGGNPHFVPPGLVTEDLLKTYLKTGQITHHFRGAIDFPQVGKTEPKAGSIVIVGSCDAIGKKATVTGFPNFEGVPVKPDVHVIGAWGKAIIYLRYHGKSGRRVSLRGAVDGIDPQTGEFLLRFSVRDPWVLSEQALIQYLADASHGEPIVSYRLTCTASAGETAPQALFLVLGRETKTDRNSGQFDGWETEPLVVLRTEYHVRDETNRGHHYKFGEEPFPELIERELAREDGRLRLAAKTSTGETLLLALESSSSGKVALRDDLYRTQPNGSIYLSDGKQLKKVATFTTAYESTTFNRRKK
jgi:hypothetical protein